MIQLRLELAEVDFIANLLAQVPTGTSVQQQMTHLLPKIAGQAQESMEREKQEAALAAAGVEQALG